jgi:XTP/dITP diphosphohydrolase
MFQLLAATNNKGKLREFRNLLEGVDDDLEVIGPDDVGGIPDVEEDGTTFEENACKKALSASNAASIAAFADDSGLVVEALNGEPGIHSARYAGENATNEERITKLLKNLEGCENRNAKFVCVIAIANDGDILATFEGEVKGTIIDTPRGEGGFGYDPIFIPEGFDKTFAELDASVKDKISHRGRAIQKAIEFCEDMADMQF